VRALTGLDMLVFPKRRFQHGAIPEEALRARLGADEAACRRVVHALFA
jgi:asparagine synthase (glutamine-hydrolysing)